MNGMGQHERKHRDRLLPVLFLIVGCGLLEVWASWLMIGSISGFPKLGGMTTGWILPVSTEAYWSIAVVAWLAAPAGKRSARYAMWTAGIMFGLSLAGQEYGHLVAAGYRIPPLLMVTLVTALPLAAVALGAVLIHLRRADREEAEALAEASAEAVRLAATERVEADERTSLRAQVESMSASQAAELSAIRAELGTAQAERETAQREAAEAHARAEALAAKLTAASARKTAPKQRAKGAASTRDDDLSTEVRAINALMANPELKKPRMGGELARTIGVSPATGRRLHAKLTAQMESGETLSERDA